MTEHENDPRGTHRTHCCIRHGCKYGMTNCVVAAGVVIQEYACEYCSPYVSDYEYEEGMFSTWPALKKILESEYFRNASPEERKYLVSYDPSKFPITCVTADVAVWSQENGAVRLLLIERGNYPFKGYWAMPGGFIDHGETAAEAAARELREEAGLEITAADLTLVGIADKPDRDPRGRTMSMVYTAWLSEDCPEVYAGDDAVNARWADSTMLAGKTLAFDHSEWTTRAWSVAYNKKRGF